MPPAESSVIALRAAEYGVAPRSVRRWRQAGAPVDDPEALRAWLKAYNKLPARARIAERRSAQAEIATEAATTDFEHLPAADIESRIQKFEQHAAACERRMNAALRGVDPEGKPLRDDAEYAYWLKLFSLCNTAAINGRLALSKLGIDAGELIARADFERLITALTIALAKGVQGLRDRLAPELTRLDFPEEIAARLEGPLLIAALLDPVATARHHAAAIGLPGWVHEAMTRAIADLIAQGQAHLDARQTALLTDTKTKNQTTHEPA